MKGLWATVTNAANGKSYFVSTVKSSRRKGLHEACVFRKIFGPIANFWRPQATFFGGDPADLHARVTKLVRDIHPGYWHVFDGHLPPSPNWIRRASGPDNRAATGA
jgi:hypothetical protein